MDGATNPSITLPSSGKRLSAFSSPPRSFTRSNKGSQQPGVSDQMTFLSQISEQLSSPTTPTNGLLQHQPFVYPHDEPIHEVRSYSSDWSGSAVSATVRKAMEAIHDVSTPAVIDSEHFDMQELEQELKHQGGDTSSQSTFLTKPSILTNQTPDHVLKPIPVSPRSVTPMMRMRQQEEPVSNPSRDMMATNQTDDEAYMAMKQRRWKEKLKIANQKREEERFMLEGGFSSPEATPPRRRRTRERANSESFSFPAAVFSCRTELAEVFEKIVSGRCGDLDDTRSDDSMESSTISTEYEDTADTTTQATSTVFMPRTLTTEDDSYGVSLDRTDSKSEVTVRTKFGMNNKQFVQDFIKMVTKSGVIMNLHTKATSLDSAKPSKCLIFIQPGHEGDNGAFSAPKLIWKSVSGTLVGQADLFAIKSLTKASALDLGDFPLAIPGRSVVVKLQRATYAFEMRSEGDAFRFTHGMRWVIARLSFNLVIGNLGASCELLDVGTSPEGHGQFPTTVGEDARWTQAMNDVTCVFVDQSGNK